VQVPDDRILSVDGGPVGKRVEPLLSLGQIAQLTLNLCTQLP
jgi:hypothetical protein